MTVDGVIDVSDWFVVERDHDVTARPLFEGDAAMLVGRKTFEGFAGLLDPSPDPGTGNRPYEAATVPVRLLEAKPFDSRVTLPRFQPLTQTLKR